MTLALELSLSTSLSVSWARCELDLLAYVCMIYISHEYNGHHSGKHKQRQKAGSRQQQRSRAAAERLRKHRNLPSAQQSGWLTENEEVVSVNRLASASVHVNVAGKQAAGADNGHSKQQEAEIQGEAAAAANLAERPVVNDRPQVADIGGKTLQEADSAASGRRHACTLQGAVVPLDISGHPMHQLADKQSGCEPVMGDSTSDQLEEDRTDAAGELQLQESPQWHMKKRSAEKTMRAPKVSPAPEVVDLRSPNSLHGQLGNPVGLPSDTQLAQGALLASVAAVQTVQDAAVSSPVPTSRSLEEAAFIPETPAEQSTCPEQPATIEGAPSARQHWPGSGHPELHLPAVSSAPGGRHAWGSLQEDNTVGAQPDLEETPSDLEPPMLLLPEQIDPSGGTSTSEAVAGPCPTEHLERPGSSVAASQGRPPPLAGSAEQQVVDHAETPSNRQYQSVDILMVAETPAVEDADDSDGDSMGPSWASMERMVSETPADCSASQRQCILGLPSQTTASLRDDIRHQLQIRTGSPPGASQHGIGAESRHRAPAADGGSEPAIDTLGERSAHIGNGTALEFWPSGSGSRDAIKDTKLQAGPSAPSDLAEGASAARESSRQNPSRGELVEGRPAHDDAFGMLSLPAADKPVRQETQQQQGWAVGHKTPAEQSHGLVATRMAEKPSLGSVATSALQAASGPVDFWPSPAAGGSLEWDALPTQALAPGSAPRLGKAALEHMGLMMQLPEPVTSVVSSTCGRCPPAKLVLRVRAAGRCSSSDMTSSCVMQVRCCVHGRCRTAGAVCLAVGHAHRIWRDQQSRNGYSLAANHACRCAPASHSADHNEVTLWAGTSKVFVQ